MQRIRHYLKSMRFFIRIMVVFCCALMLTIVVLLFFLNGRFFHYMQNDAYSLFEQMAATYAAQFDNLHQMTTMSASILTSSSQIKSAFLGKADSQYDRFAINNKIRSILTQFPYIDSISVIDTRHGFYYNSSIVDTAMQQADADAFFGSKAVNVYCFIPREPGIVSSTGHSLISMVIPVGYRSSVRAEGNSVFLSAGIVINISSDYFLNAHLEKTAAGGNSIAILNQAEILCLSSQMPFAEVEETITTALSKINGLQGRMDIQSKGKRYMLVYHVDTNYTFLVFNHYDQIFAGANIYLKQTYLMICLILLLSVLAVLALLRKSYNTLAYVVADVSDSSNEVDLFSYANDELEYIRIRFRQMKTAMLSNARKLETSAPYIRNQLISDLLNGKAPLNVELLKEHFPNLTSKSRFTVISLIIHLPDDGAGSAPASRALTQRLEIEQLASGYLAKNGSYAFVLYEAPYHQPEYLHTHIICAYQDTQDRVTALSLRPLSEQFRERNALVAICVGEEVNQLKDIHLSYQAALLLEKLVFIKGLHMVAEAPGSPHLSVSDFVSHFKLKNLLRKINSVQREAVHQELDSIFEKLSGCSPEFAHLIISTLFYHILETGSLILKSIVDEELPFDLDEVYKELNRQPTLSDVKAFTTRFCDTLLDIITEAQSNQRYQLYRRITSIVDKELCNPELSVLFISSCLNLSSGYIGKVFSAYNDCALAEYINKRRVMEASRLLRNTALSSADIGRQVGFQSGTYFTTVFKRYTGITPSAFRKQPSKE